MDHQEDEEEDPEEDPEYEDDFADDDGPLSTRLTPTGSDGELLDLVLAEPSLLAGESTLKRGDNEDPLATTRNAPSSAEPTARKSLLPVGSDSELIDILQQQLEVEARNDGQDHDKPVADSPQEDESQAAMANNSGTDHASDSSTRQTHGGDRGAACELHIISSSQQQQQHCPAFDTSAVALETLEPSSTVSGG
ncbi:hypothetical protein P43SY_010871 [Pythium insidiosum]|uniref:Uncharacterized protein n=1 Tax=Pythium insidiosum TaxID=114742 RepID=A0AAD5L5A9_PYTIN|nr:hypothetical protein P43SY_010871 [Pythium insidiosum]